MISPAKVRRRVTEKIIKKRPTMAAVKSSRPLRDFSISPEAVMIWTVPVSMTAREISPLIPMRKVRRVEVRLSPYEIQPRAVSSELGPHFLGVKGVMPPLGVVVEFGSFGSSSDDTVFLLVASL